MSFHFMDYTLTPSVMDEVLPLPAIYMASAGNSPEEDDKVMEQCLSYCETLNAGDPMIFREGLGPSKPELSELRTYCEFNPCADVIIGAVTDVANTLAERLEFEAFCRINSARLHVVDNFATSLLTDCGPVDADPVELLRDRTAKGKSAVGTYRLFGRPSPVVLGEVA